MRLRSRVALLAFVVLLAFPTSLMGDVVLSDVIHNYGGLISIEAKVTDQGGSYLWEYTVTNLAYAPVGGNGFSGFELALPAFVPDIGNITNPAGWDVNCCSGLPVEWDIEQPGVGILVGESAVFSFTTDPRFITLSTGWFHSWSPDPGSFQIDIHNYSDFSCSAVAFVPCAGPEVPDVLKPPIPEPSTMLLLATGVVGLASRLRRRIAG